MHPLVAPGGRVPGVQLGLCPERLPDINEARRAFAYYVSNASKGFCIDGARLRLDGDGIDLLYDEISNYFPRSRDSHLLDRLHDSRSLDKQPVFALWKHHKPV